MTKITLMAGTFAVLFGLAVIALGALRGRDSGRSARRMMDQIDRYGPRQRGPGQAQPEAGGGIAFFRWLVRSSNAEPALAVRLDRAGSSRRPAEWALLSCTVSVALIALLILITRNVVVGVPVGGLVGWLAMRLVLSVKISRRRAAFDSQLPDMLQLVASSLQAGFSLPQALDAVTREETQPMTGEISRAIAETRIGVNLETALGGVAERMDSNDLRWTVMAIRIQREVGGNLAEVLRTTIGTIRERGYLRRQVRALSAEGRLSSYVLICLPIAIGGWLLYSNPAYTRVLYTTAAGIAMLIAAGILFIIGVIWIRALIKLEV